ncbi:MAG: succinylglutamate desuccinylase/aspartoacylase family protein [Rhodocyclaceae bacterium]|nr:succinylglutamate desuccinylase/aspartoacylase family protein [Rhodocyclaceae bacterium]
MARRAAFEIDGRQIAAGTRETVELPISVLSDHTPIALSVHVVHGARPGPTVFVSAAVHGDEIIGVEVIRRLLRSPALQHLAGTLMCVPVVNAFGFISHQRYLPDRRDLNRSFPGSANGSLAAQLAHKFLTQIVARCEVGIDLHSASIHRVNLPQIRVAPDAGRPLELGLAFGAPIVLLSELRDGSLRAAARELGVDMLLYEAGEGLRFDELAIRAGVAGILRVLRELRMTPRRHTPVSRHQSSVSRSSVWVRAPAGGILRAYRTIGDSVAEGEVIACVSDPFGEKDAEVCSRAGGLIIGRANLPVVNQGDALFHIARVASPQHAEDGVEKIAVALQSDPLLDEDEIL